MRKQTISLEEFLKLPAQDIRDIVSREKKPEVGIFVPDGTRRMVMAFTKTLPGSEEFFAEYFRLTSRYFMNNVEVFFTHGLQTLFVPLISSYIFTGSKKPQHAGLRKILETIFSNQDWLDFYKKNDIRVRAYGNLKYLGTNDYAGVLDLLENVMQTTSGNRSHTIFYGFASATEDCGDIIAAAIEFYKTYNRQPTHEEQMDYYYGRNVSPADFFIMSAKFAGLGALPPLIVNRHTQLYFLAAPGVMALTADTYRKILYDLLFCRPAESRREYTKNDLKHAESLKNYFLANRSTVFGLGKRIGHSWTPVIEPVKSLKKEGE